MTARLQDWRTQFGALVQSRARTPFAWGRNDCALWAADCVWAITGQDPAADLRGAYSTELGAARVLLERGGLAQIATDALGAPIAPLLATVGDVVLVRTAQGEALAVCNGDHLLGPTSSGLAVYSLADGLQAWRVGHHA